MENRGFDQSFIEKLKANNDIVSVISKYCNVQRKGKTWWTCCPFHLEKTPSFAINDYEQYYHCFGCGVSGDVISFVEKKESMDFYDACKFLADNAKMELPEFVADESIVKRKKEMEKSLEILRETARYYRDNLSLPESKIARDYISKRGLDDQTVRTFGLGYSLGYTEVIQYLTRKGYTKEEMKNAGIVTENEKGDYYDCYGKRLIFPLINSRGDVVGFSGRVLEDKGFAKYKNTAQTNVFDKSKTVYSINNIKKQRQSGELSEIIIVEGQMDVISLYKSGVKNAIACLGTALTPLHAKELHRFSDKVVVCFDGDGAGKKATYHSLDILVAEGLDVFVLAMPEGLDPDEYILKYGKDKYLSLVHSAKYWTEFLIYDLASGYNLNEPNERSAYVKRALEVVKKLQSASEQDIYLKLIGKLVGISAEILRRDLNSADIEKPKNKIRSTEESEEKKPELEVNNANAYVKSVQYLLACLIHKKPYAIYSNAISDNLYNSDLKKLYEYAYDLHKQGKELIIGNIYNNFDVENIPEIKAIINYTFLEGNDNETYYSDCLKNIQVASVENRMEEINKSLAVERNSEKRMALMKELGELIRKRKK